MGTQKASISSSFSSARIAQPSGGGLLVISPRDAGATVVANDIKPYRQAQSVIDDHGANSDLAFSAPFALANIQRWFMGSFADGANAAVGSRTFGANPGPAASTGTLPASETNIYELTTVTIDGTAVDRINYTVADPTTETLDDSGDGEVWFNPITRAFKTSRASSGAGAGIILTYKRADLSPILAQALQQPIRSITFGGNWRHVPQYAAAWRALTSFANANDWMTYGAVVDSPVRTDADFQAVVAANRSDSLQLIGAQQVFPDDEDLGVAYAAQNAKTPAGHTLKDQSAPKGITYSTTLPYTRDDYGDDVDPAADTFHKIGVNIIAPSDDGGTFIISSERSTNDYSTSTEVLFGGQRKQANAALDLIRFRVNRAITDPKGRARFNQAGMKAVEGEIIAGMHAAAVDELIDPENSSLNFPDLSETDEVDRKKRNLVGTSMELRIVNPIQTVDMTVVVTQ